MAASSTSVLRSLTQQEIIDLGQESSNISFWKRSWRQDDLLPGTVHFVKFVNDQSQVIYDNLNQFPATQSLIESISPNSKIGRIHWYRFLPMERLGPYSWAAHYFLQNNLLLHRYHILLNLPNTFALRIDNNFVTDVSIYNNKVLDLALGQEHFFFNISSTPTYMLMIDILDPSVVLN